MTNKNAISKRLTIHHSLLTNFAFTLAETLIVMGIIGVVAALTLPNLNSSTGDKEKIAKFKKIYSNLNDAVGRAQSVYGPIDEWFLNDSTALAKSKRAAERITEFMKISKSCTNNTTAGCMKTGQTKNLANTNYTVQPVDTNTYTYILADGTSLAISASNTSVHFFIDTDGPNKGNFTYGVDVFQFHANNDGLYYSKTSSNSSNLANCSGDIALIMTCEAWILDNDNMDYIKADKNGKCPNGTQLSDTVTSCK